MNATKKISHLLQAAVLLVIALLFRLLPMDAASALGGRLARMLGPLLRPHRIAERNLSRIFPQWDERRRAAVLSGMWDNLGRVMGEYPHLSPASMRRRITIEGAEYLEDIRKNHRACVFVSAHLANWEVCPLVGVLHQLPIHFIYREANNPYAEKIIQWMRRGYRDRMYGKGRESAQQFIRALKQKDCVAMLADQKFNEGSPVPFFGHPAMTVTSAARLAIKFRVPLVPLRVVRTDGAHFHVTIGQEIPHQPSDTPEHLMEKFHHVLEQWITEKPEQWFWVHNRWSWK